MKLRTNLPFKLIFVVLFITGIMTVSLSQVPVTTDKGNEDKVYKGRKYEKVMAAQLLKGTTTMVVVDKRIKAYSDSLVNTFARYWKYTPYKFITPAEVAKYAGRNGFSFFMFVRDEQEQKLVSSFHTGSNGQTYSSTGMSYSKPDLYFKSDSMRHRPGKGFFGASDDYYSTYMFVVAISNGEGIEDSTEEDITSGLSIADYCYPVGDVGFKYAYAGSMLGKEKEAIPELSPVVRNFENDLEYMAKKKREKKGIQQTKECSLTYKEYTLKYKLDILNYEEGKNIWMNKVIIINNKLLNESERSLLARLLGTTDDKVRLVPATYIDSIKKAVYNDDMMIWDITENEYGGYGYDIISSVDGFDLLRIDRDQLRKICKERKPATGIFKTKQCTVKYNGNNEEFKLGIDDYSGVKDCSKNKVLFISDKICNDFGRTALVGLFGLNDDKVKLVTGNALDSIKRKADNADILLMDGSLDATSGNYLITTADGIELMDIDNVEFAKICKYKRDSRSESYEGKCELLYYNKSYTFKFHFVVFGGNLKNTIKDKTLFIDSTYVDELGRGIIGSILGLEDGKVKRVSKSTINSLIGAADRNNLLFTDATLNEFQNYSIKTTDGSEVIGISTNGFSKGYFGTLDLIGTDKWSDRKNMVIKR